MLDMILVNIEINSQARVQTGIFDWFLSNFGILIEFFQFFDQIRDFESYFGLVSCFWTRFWLLFRFVGSYQVQAGVLSSYLIKRYWEV